MKRLIVFLCLICITMTGNSQPLEMIRLKDGTRLYGYIQKQEAKSISFHTDFAYRVIPKKDKFTSSPMVDLAAWKADEDVAENYEYLKRLDRESIFIDGSRITVLDIEDANGKVVYSGAIQDVNAVKGENVIKFWDLKSGSETVQIEDMVKSEKLYVTVNDHFKIQNTYDIKTNWGVYDEYRIKSDDGSSDETVYKGMVVSQETGKSTTISVFNSDMSAFQKLKTFSNSSISKLERKAINPEHSIMEQSKFLDVVSKRDGTEYKGMITERDFDEKKLTIETKDNGIKVVSMMDVASYGKVVNPDYSMSVSLAQVEEPSVSFKYWINDIYTEAHVSVPVISEDGKYTFDKHYAMVNSKSFSVKTDNAHATLKLIELHETDTGFYFDDENLAKMSSPKSTKEEGAFKVFNFSASFSVDKSQWYKYFAVYDGDANAAIIVNVYPATGR